MESLKVDIVKVITLSNFNTMYFHTFNSKKDVIEPIILLIFLYSVWKCYQKFGAYYFLIFFKVSSLELLSPHRIRRSISMKYWNYKRLCCSGKESIDWCKQCLYSKFYFQSTYEHLIYSKSYNPKVLHLTLHMGNQFEETKDIRIVIKVHETLCSPGDFASHGNTM